MALTYHTGRRGFLGFLKSLNDSDGVARAGVIPAFSQVDSSGNPVVSGSAITWTRTTVTLVAATSATLLAANTSRKALRWMVTGTNPCTIVPGAGPAVAGTGMNYGGASGTGQQGGSDSFNSSDISTQQFSAISTGGTTVEVWEGQ